MYFPSIDLGICSTLKKNNEFSEALKTYGFGSEYLLICDKSFLNVFYIVNYSSMGHCKPGWAKHQYWQVDKNTFQQAKDAALEAPDACPVVVIQQFINRLWQWMSAYRIGLARDAAQWAVQKQKGHRSVSQVAMMHSDAVLIIYLIYLIYFSMEI